MPLDQELQQYLYAIVSARVEGSVGKEWLRSFLDRHFEQLDASPSLSASSQSYMASVVEAMDFFVEFCILLFAKGYGAPPPGGLEKHGRRFGRHQGEQQSLPTTRLPLSMWDRHRLRRALLRFQLFCELFHQPGDSSLDGVDDWEERLAEQEFFWLRYEWWEVEEVKCIYQLIVFSLDLDLLSKETSGLGTWMDQEGHHEERGLPQLRHFLDDTPKTPFGQSYLRRFLTRAFRGFSQVDPEDLNYFSHPRPLYKRCFGPSGVEPQGTYRSLFPSPHKGRRYKPSPYPGIQLEYITDPKLNPGIPQECKPFGSNTQDVKRFVRLVGWVFWDRNSLYDWHEFRKSFDEFRIEAGDFGQMSQSRGWGRPFFFDECCSCHA